MAGSARTSSPPAHALRRIRCALALAEEDSITPAKAQQAAGRGGYRRRALIRGRWRWWRSSLEARWLTSACYRKRSVLDRAEGVEPALTSGGLMPQLWLPMVLR